MKMQVEAHAIRMTFDSGALYNLDIANSSDDGVIYFKRDPDTKGGHVWASRPWSELPQCTKLVFDALFDRKRVLLQRR